MRRVGLKPERDAVTLIADRVERMQLVESVHYRKQLLQLIDRRARAFSYATLFIGIVTSMFTAILGSRALVNLIYGGKRLTKLAI